MRTNLTNQVRGLVKSFGGRIPSCSPEAFPKVAREVLPRKIAGVLGPLLTAHEVVTKKIRIYDKRIEKLAAKRYAKQTEKLRQIKGVGPITALAFVLVVGDPKRFTKSRDVAPYLGLVPKRDQSGLSDKQLSITKAGCPMMRKLLVTSANYLMGPFGEDCRLRRYGDRIAARGGDLARRKAKVAVARKLAVLMHCLLTSEADYDPLYNPTTA